MADPKIICVVPTCRPERFAEFRRSWTGLFERHGVRLVSVHDGDRPEVTVFDRGDPNTVVATAAADRVVPDDLRDCFCRYTDSVRNYGFVYAARNLDFDFVLTLDDDVAPPPAKDPIAEHLSVMLKRCSTTWLNTAQGTNPDNIPYVRGFPYSVRDEAVVHLSHGVWVGVPDFDARTQLAYGGGCDIVYEKVAGTPGRDVPCPKCGSWKWAHPISAIPKYLNFYRGPIPDLCNMPICGMNLMCSREALSLLYYAPMGPDSGFPDMHRFGDIFMGVSLLREFGDRRWAVWTGTSVVEHTRASDAKKNLALEAVGIEAHDRWARVGDAAHDYYLAYREKRLRYQDHIEQCLARK